MKHRLAVLALAVVFLCSCSRGLSLRKQVDLPEDKLALLASQIEDLVVNAREEGPTISDFKLDEYGDVTSDFSPLDMMISTDEIRESAPALADLNVDNEIMITSIRGRVLRRPAIYDLEQTGCVGENNRGLLQYMKGEWCPKDRELRRRASYVVLTENRDRRAIWAHLVEANDWGQASLERIREIFTEQIHKKAWADTPLQTPSGVWERRKP